MAVGLAVGLMPLAWYLIEQVFFAPEVEYNGVYEPLPGVDMITSRQDSLDSPFEFRLGLLPFLGAISRAWTDHTSTVKPRSTSHAACPPRMPQLSVV